MAALGYVVIRNREPERSTEAFCSKMEAARTLGAALADLDPSKIEEPHKALQEAWAVAPADIEQQMAALVTYTDGLVEAMKTSPETPMEAAAKWLEEHNAEADAIAADGTRVQDFTREHCGFELDEAPRTIPD